MGKKLHPPLTSAEKRGDVESVDSPSTGIRRHTTPPPITRPGGHYQCSPEKTPRKTVGDQLIMENRMLATEIKKLRSALSEIQLEKSVLEHKVESLEIGLTSKVKRLYEITGKGHLFNALP